MVLFRILLFCALSILMVCGQEQKEASQSENESNRDAIYIGPCTWIIERNCPDKDVRFWLFTRKNPEERQNIYIDETWENSNLSSSYYDPNYPVKIIIHGYNSDMHITPLIEMRQEYLQKGDFNLLYVDWAVLGPAPCYPAAVHNLKHVANCTAQLISRIRETGNSEIHLVGFSLGAQMTNYIANFLKPNFIIPRITGLDPAMPLFVTTNVDNKLDPSDAEFVDVIHTNALVQGKIEQCGHVDFYLNGGIYQPGCSGFGVNPFQCSHHRAPNYFAESITSIAGFWGFKCQSYVYFMLGLCPPTSEMQAVAGEDCRMATRGMYFINTNAAAPFALGRIADSINMNRASFPEEVFFNPISHIDPFQKEIDTFGKLEGNFNNMPFSNFQDDPGYYFKNHGSNKIAHDFVSRF